jgi:hypothetical protein
MPTNQELLDVITKLEERMFHLEGEVFSLEQFIITGNTGYPPEDEEKLLDEHNLTSHIIETVSNSFYISIGAIKLERDE